jgi:hypothetical protein
MPRQASLGCARLLMADLAKWRSRSARRRSRQEAATPSFHARRLTAASVLEVYMRVRRPESRLADDLRQILVRLRRRALPGWVDFLRPPGTEGHSGQRAGTLSAARSRRSDLRSAAALSRRLCEREARVYGTDLDRRVTDAVQGRLANARRSSDVGDVTRYHARRHYGDSPSRPADRACLRRSSRTTAADRL